MHIQPIQSSQVFTYCSSNIHRNRPNDMHIQSIQCNHITHTRTHTHTHTHTCTHTHTHTHTNTYTRIHICTNTHTHTHIHKLRYNSHTHIPQTKQTHSAHEKKKIYSLALSSTPLHLLGECWRDVTSKPRQDRDHAIVPHSLQNLVLQNKLPGDPRLWQRPSPSLNIAHPGPAAQEQSMGCL